MSTIDETLRDNEKFTRAFDQGSLSAPPRRKLAVVACMDARMNIEEMLGLRAGDAHIIRNAGGIASEDALRSLLISHYMLGTQEFMVINHTDCGMQTFRDEDLRARLVEIHQAAPDIPAAFFTFHDLEQNVREQVAKIKSHPWTPKEVPVRGFIYDVRSGRLTEVT